MILPHLNANQTITMPGKWKPVPILKNYKLISPNIVAYSLLSGKVQH